MNTQPTSPQAGVSLRHVLSQQELPEVPTAYSADHFLASFPLSHFPSPTGSPPQYTTAVSCISVSASASGGTHLRPHIVLLPLCFVLSDPPSKLCRRWATAHPYYDYCHFDIATEKTNAQSDWQRQGPANHWRVI